MPGPDLEGILLCICSTRLIMELLSLLKLKDNDLSCFKTLKCCLYRASKC